MKCTKLFCTLIFFIFCSIHIFSQNENFNPAIGDSTARYSKDKINIGYGNQNKYEVTGSVYKLGADDFNKGFILSPFELIMGKIPGVNISSGNGIPGSDFTIINRGISAFLSNDLLVVVDDLPLNGARLNINTHDIESITILKDATLAGIYGERAYNGVLFIKTKRGSEKLALNYTANFSFSQVPKLVDVLSGDEIRNYMYTNYSDPNVLNLLGSKNTNWQQQIYRSAYGMDHSLSLSGTLLNTSFRLSIGRTDEDGVVKTTNFKRNTLSLALDHSFLNDHLHISANFNSMFNSNQVADAGVVERAIEFDPSQPVFNNSRYGGYFTWMTGNTPNPLVRNPMATLGLENNTSEIDHLIGNVKLDYKLHFFPELKVVLNYGQDKYQYNTRNLTDTLAPWSSYTRNSKNNETTLYKTLELYLNYARQFHSNAGKLDITIGASRLNSKTDESSFVAFPALPDAYYAVSSNSLTKIETSYFARFIIDVRNKYFLTGIAEANASTYSNPRPVWVIYPAISLAWRIKSEPFLINNSVLSDLKLHIGYGISGASRFPEAYNVNALIWPRIKDEMISTTTLGLDYAFLNNRIAGSIDYYNKITDNLIMLAPSFLGGGIINNNGKMRNSGLEAGLNINLIRRNDWNWNITGNMAYDLNKVISLKGTGYSMGDIVGGVGNTIQILRAGLPLNSFYVFQQVYSNSGKPVEGLYVDRSGEGGDISHNNNNLYPYEKAAPDLLAGIGSDLKYKNWGFSFSGRISLGNYVYNNVNSLSYYGLINNSNIFFMNVSRSVINSGFINSQYFSDYYVQNASFFRMDYICLNYQFKNIFNRNIALKLCAAIQNAFVITQYKGQDPEQVNGIEGYAVPRPRMFSLSLSADF